MEYLLQHLLMNSSRDFFNKTAIVCGDEDITFGELESQTNQLAVTLIDNGVRRGDRIGIYTNKSIPSIVSIFGILKAGAAYVPLDPNAPPSRLSYIIQNCGIRCVLTSARKASSLFKIASVDNALELVVITDDRGTVPEQSDVPTVQWHDVVERGFVHPPVSHSAGTDLAFILYTSGSTGAPKGVMISHLNSLTFVNWAQKTMGVISEDRLANHAPLHFDLSVFDIFSALKVGATLILVPDGISSFPYRLAEWIEDNRVSIWYSVPSVLSMMVRDGQLERFNFANLRTVMFAGEVFPVKYLHSLMTLIPHADYYNLYGPTETNVITYHRIEKIPPEQADPIPIGKPCANTEVFALSDEGEIITQPGQVGQLFARGPCVAMGYWGDKRYSRGKFISSSQCPGSSEMTYKTGDLVTVDKEGNFLFLGRRDQMVKIRGYRVELGEIESTLYTHPWVREVAVVAIPSDTDGNRIKAFVVPEDVSLNPKELQNFCLRKIPKYMLPEFIEIKEQLPKTSTGKIDKLLLVAQEKSV